MPNELDVIRAINESALNDKRVDEIIISTGNNELDKFVESIVVNLDTEQLSENLAHFGMHPLSLKLDNYIKDLPGYESREQAEEALRHIMSVYAVTEEIEAMQFILSTLKKLNSLCKINILI